jgi:AhpD family alkylhydroperoxidase
MNRQQVYDQIKEMFGLVPGFFKAIPDSSLEMEWNLFKRVQFDEGPIPNKYRELMGLAIAAVTKCRYCAFFHTEAARLNGATDAEIEDAVHFAKSSAGWSAYINGLQTDFEQFKDEVLQICEHVRSLQAVEA